MSDLSQLKLTSFVWDGDKEPHLFHIWVKAFGSMVRSMEHGAALEEMLDIKLNRKGPLKTCIPSYLLEDPDFYPENAPSNHVSSDQPDQRDDRVPRKPPEDPGEFNFEEFAAMLNQADSAESRHMTPMKAYMDKLKAENEALKADRDAYDSGSISPRSPSHSKRSGVTGIHSLCSGGIPLLKQPPKVQLLDGRLYNILRQCVKGTKVALLEHVTFPSYVQGMCNLHKHMGMSRLHRMKAAFACMTQLSYKGSVTQFQTEFMQAKAELDDCGATIMHFSLCSLMDSFEGKSKPVQFKIAEDFNAIDEGQEEQVNLYDLVQKYCSELAAVGDGIAPVNICTECQSPAHKIEDCPTHKLKLRNAENRKKHNAFIRGKRPPRPPDPEWEKTVNCHNCGEKGHIRPNCPHPKVDQANGKVTYAQGSAIDQILSPRSTSSYRTASSAPYYTPPSTPPPYSNRTPVSPSRSLTPAEINQHINHVRYINELNQRANPVLMVKPGTDRMERVHLSLGDGMGLGALLTRVLETDVTRYIGVEIDPIKRTLCDNVNPPDTSPFGGVDHSWHNDVHDITRNDIIDLGPGVIKRLDIAAPCKDHSKSRLLPTQSGKPGGYRPGFAGEHGKVLLKCIEVLSWVMEHNPECEIFMENVVFDDMEDDWNFISSILGEPIIIDSSEHSYTRRLRAYWMKNIPLPTYDQFIAGFHALDPNECLDEGRTAEEYKVDGKITTRHIGASWAGDPDKPFANTTLALWINDVNFDAPQHLHSEEAESLLWLPKGITAGNGVKEIDRLRGLGDGWDFNTVVMLNRNSKLANKTITGPPFAPTDRVSRNSESTLPDVNLAEATEAYDTGDNARLAEILFNRPASEQLKLLNMILFAKPHDYEGSVLDSGSSRHLNPNTHVLQSDVTIPLTGFNESEPSTWTQGNGYLPIQLTDMNSNAKISMDLDDADKLSGVSCPILSMGKLVKRGWKILLEGPNESMAVAPDGQHRFKVELGDDDIFRLPHKIREGSNAAPLPPIPGQTMAVKQGATVLNVKGSYSSVNVQTLHDIFCHCGNEKLTRTLEQTIGFKAHKLPTFFCPICTQVKARRRGLHQGSWALLTEEICPPCTLQCPPCNPAWNPVLINEEGVKDEVYDDEDHDSGDEPEEPLMDIEYISPVVGRALGEQPVPRFDLDILKPFEIMFADNKDYVWQVRGGYKTSFILSDLKSMGPFKVDLHKKSQNGLAFREIVATNGIHKLPYKCTIYTDGCGSMRHVEVAATLMGINHAYLPPYEPGLNEAEKICLNIWDDAEAILMRANAPSHYFAEAVSYAMYVKLRMSTTASRNWKTPYEIIKGIKPNVSKLHRFFTLSYVTTPKQKRKALEKKGHHGRSELGRLLGFRGPYSNCYRVILSENRLIHSINVKFNDADFIVKDPPKMITKSELQPGSDIIFSYDSERKEGDILEEGVNPYEVSNPELYGQASLLDSSLVSDLSLTEYYDPQLGRIPKPMLMDPFIDIELNELFPRTPSPWHDRGTEKEYWTTPTEDFMYKEGPPQDRPRPSYAHQMLVERAEKNSKNLCRIEKAYELGSELAYDAVGRILSAMCVPDQGKQIDHGSIRDADLCLAVLAQKDMSWKKALAGEDSAKVIESFHAERDSLLNTVLIKIEKDDPRYQEYHDLAVTGRYLLDVKRTGKYKTRGVKQGFKEDKLTADGYGFNYYSHVVKLYTFRIAFFRTDRNVRRVAILDQSTAFLQSDKFPEHIKKYLLMRNPITLEWELFRQTGPLYGENSAPRRWEDTYAPYLETLGFIRGDNDRCIFYHPERDVLNLTFVDDNFIDADEDDINWTAKAITDRFKCKDLEWVELDGTPVDYLGMHISVDAMDSMRTYLSMEHYIANCLEILGWESLKPTQTPIRKQINPEGDSPPLPSHLAAQFHTGLGMIGWMSNTARIDISYTYSRIGQHQANPTEDAMDALQYAFRYLSGARTLTLSTCLEESSIDVWHAPLFVPQLNDQYGWKFFVDTDFAGNTEVQNKRRSQMGMIATHGGAPVFWKSGVSTVCFACDDLEEAHADFSSGASEVFGAGNATQEFLHIGYVSEESGIPFPKPFVLLMDNDAARIFADDTCFKSRMKHIDCRQEWVKVLRDRDICTPTRVDSKQNLADFLTKILEPQDFLRLREQLMYKPSE